MNLMPFFKSLLEQDSSPIVICDLNHIILYMNPVAIKRYEKAGGASLLGSSLCKCHNEASNKAIEEVLAWFSKSKENNIVYTSRNDKEYKDVYMVALRDEEGNLIGYYEKHCYRSNETGTFYNMQ